MGLESSAGQTGEWLLDRGCWFIHHSSAGVGQWLPATDPAPRFTELFVTAKVEELEPILGGQHPVLRCHDKCFQCPEAPGL